MAKVTLGPAVLAQAGATNELLAKRVETAQPFLTIWMKIKNAQLAGSTDIMAGSASPRMVPMLRNSSMIKDGRWPRCRWKREWSFLTAIPRRRSPRGTRCEDALDFQTPARGRAVLATDAARQSLGDDRRVSLPDPAVDGHVRPFDQSASAFAMTL